MPLIDGITPSSLVVNVMSRAVAEGTWSLMSNWLGPLIHLYHWLVVWWGSHCYCLSEHASSSIGWEEQLPLNIVWHFLRALNKSSLLPLALPHLSCILCCSFWKHKECLFLFEESFVANTRKWCNLHVEMSAVQVVIQGWDRFISMMHHCLEKLENLAFVSALRASLWVSWEKPFHYTMIFLTKRKEINRFSWVQMIFLILNSKITTRRWNLMSRNMLKI